MDTTSASQRPRAVVAGGGVAALEALLALHELGGRQLRLALLAPGSEFLNRPASVAAPFGLGGPRRAPFADVTRRCGAELLTGTLAGIDGEGAAFTGTGDHVPFDALVIAVGGRAATAPPGTVAFAGPQDVPALEEILADAARGDAASIAFAIPAGVAWTLPLYELAIMTAVDLANRGAAHVGLTVVTPEPAPLHLFGSAASDAVGELLAGRGIDLVHGRATEARDGRLELEGGASVPADAAVVLPPIHGPWIEGLQSDEHGFIPVDRHGRVAGHAGVYAAGDATSFPIKQGGLATQQADAAAAAVVSDLCGTPPGPAFQPVLRGLLLTGGAPLYLRAELHGSKAVGDSHPIDALRSEVSTRALWWPPGKVAGRYLAPFLATARPTSLSREPLADRSPTGPRGPDGDREAALELALLLADEDERAGDLTQALHALEAAAALGGGTLPAAVARRRDAISAKLVRRDVP